MGAKYIYLLALRVAPLGRNAPHGIFVKAYMLIREYICNVQVEKPVSNQFARFCGCYEVCVCFYTSNFGDTV